jgi:para-aminobenzoate synthetase/4-amino-4-deoxychorismate lyase
LPLGGVRFLFDDQRAAPELEASLLFERPVARIVAQARTEVAPALAWAESERARGRHVCGVIAYEASAHAGTRPPTAPIEPLVELYAFEDPVRMTSDDVTAWLAREAPERVGVYDVSWTETPESYRQKIAAIKRHIVAGETYQVNFTFKCRFAIEGSGLALYRALRGHQRVGLGAYARLGEREIVSLSPELFVQKAGDWVTLEPMKGTAPRGASPEEDASIVERLKTDPKTLSENVMIVDLVRNDLSRIAQVGSVEVERLFAIETYETLHQMVSRVRGRVAAPLADVMAAVFPCGSVTGAPKIRTMQIIDRLESEARGVYTGALGRVAPNGDFVFSVPIRTMVVRGARGEMGIGSGIVHASDADAELEECRLKAAFLTRANDRLALLETMRFDVATRSVVDLDAHLDRMAASARAFSVPCGRETIALTVLEAVASRSQPCKVRVLLSMTGEPRVSVETLETAARPNGELPRVAVSDKTIDSSSCFRRHKTTARELYDEEYAAHAAKGAYDVLFLNERGEVAEASRHNVFVEKAGTLVTPRVDSGALPGIERARVLADPRFRAHEGLVTLATLRSADRLWLTNSVRGMVEVALCFT